ncbi:MAG: phosphoribosylformylglycinamidine cyclo-ligase [Deltaproteobacteria bacterium]|nr:phosphoribosylformylglycinamidine cyclo-ligase [Deltaproteobacteria bacterium]MBM4324025.1 phosphoribosylformylglycinamidine cyclo-ligase [Deltaproteobacteria bacterium]MBM4347798.1 phosphoribosylformylglycinamidine cyclo-ligase [Deltaproteobacteria bacterium]
MKKFSYKDSGVDVEKGDSFVQAIKSMVEATFRPDVMTKIGGFAGCVSLNLERYKKPVLVSSTDGVGTKLKIAFLMDRHDTIGIDLVAMCVNDIIVSGARPLFLLDYFATSRLDQEKAMEVVSGIAKGCMEAECSLIGGETAEMPGFYVEGEYDLAGFVVGIVENSQMIDGSGVTVGDKLIGIASSGLHSNGYSLVRKIILEHLRMDLSQRVDEIGEVLGDELLRPTRIYVRTVLPLIRDFNIGGIAHITGGGITGNLPRVIPKGCKAIVRKGTWDIPPIFPFLQEKGNISEDEMFKTFNNGIGMILIVKSKEAEEILGRLRSMGEKAFSIGEIGKAEKEEDSIELI